MPGKWQEEFLLIFTTESVRAILLWSIYCYKYIPGKEKVMKKNTSRLACDGSGTVVRDPGNHSLCTFQNGKRYNCDLSASYNIGARYFIRELLKPLPATERFLLEAKVPSVKRRISCVYADLRELFLEMELLRAA